MQTLFFALVASCLTLVLHETGLLLSLYWQCWWFDLVVHFLGGLAIGFFAHYFLQKKYHAVYAALAVALCWELFEVGIVQIPVAGASYFIDTILDVIIGMVGVFGARYVVHRPR